MNSNFFEKFAIIESYLTKLDIKADSVLTVQTGTIVDTNDEAYLGRVKVKLDTRGENSTRWSYFLGYPSGQIPSEYIRNGTRVACIASYGNANEMLIIGTFGYGSSPNPVSLPIISFESHDRQPICNERSLGQLILFDNKNGSDINICVRSGSDYSWRKLHSSLITESQGYTSEQLQKINEGVLSETLEADDDYIPFAPLPVCDQSKQGQILPFSERDEWRQFNVICSKDENGTFRWKPASTIPIFTRNSLPNPTEEYHGTLIQIDDGANSYLAYCARQNGVMKWMKYSGREAISFNNITTNDRPNNKSKNSPDAAVPNPAEDSKTAKKPEEDRTPSLDTPLENARDIVSSLAKAAGLGDKNLEDLKKSWADQISKNLGIPADQIVGALQSGLKIADQLGVVDIPDNIPGAVKNILTSNDPLNAILGSSAQVLKSYGQPEVSAVMYGVVSGGWQGAIDAATNQGLKQLPPEFRSGFGDFIGKIGGVDSLPGPIKDIAKSALGEINIGLPEVSKYIFSGSLFNDLSNVNFDLSKIDLSINPDNIGNFLKSILPGNIDLSNLKIDAKTLSSSLSAIADFAGFGDEFSSLFSGGLGTELANFLLPGINQIFSGKSPDPCPCNNRKCNMFKDPVKGGESLIEDCKTVISGMSTYNIDNATITNNNPIANGLGLFYSGKGQQILTPDLLVNLPAQFGASQFADATKAILGTQVNDLSKTINDGVGARGDFLQTLQELRYTGETTTKVLKVVDNNITQLEITDGLVIDGVMSILKDIFGCGLPGGGLLNQVNGVIQDFMSITSTLATITSILNNVTNAGVGSDIQSVIDNISTLSGNLGGINDKISSIACQIKADFVQPAKDLNTSLEPGNPGGSGQIPFTKEELEITENNEENLSKESLISSVFDGIPNPRIGRLPNRISALSEYPNKDKIDSILNEVFKDPTGIEQTFPETPEQTSDAETINNILDGLKPDEESGRFTGEKDCR